MSSFGVCCTLGYRARVWELESQLEYYFPNDCVVGLPLSWQESSVTVVGSRLMSCHFLSWLKNNRKHAKSEKQKKLNNFAEKEGPNFFSPRTIKSRPDAMANGKHLDCTNVGRTCPIREMDLRSLTSRPTVSDKEAKVTSGSKSDDIFVQYYSILQ